MDKKDLKKLLAGLSLVALVTGAGLTVSGCVTTGTGGSDNQATSTSNEPDTLTG